MSGISGWKGKGVDFRRFTGIGIRGLRGDGKRKETDGKLAGKYPGYRELHL